MSQEQARRRGEDAPNRNLELSGADTDAVNQITTDAASMHPPPGFKATQDIDFISSNQGGAPASLNPRLVGSQHNNDTLSYVSSGKLETCEGGDNNVISGIPGGMGASMATADHRVSKNK